MDTELYDLKFSFRNRCREIKEKRLMYLSKYDMYKDMSNYDNFKDLMTENQFKDVLKDKRRREGKRYRANKKLRSMVGFFENKEQFLHDVKLVFCTCTFNDSQFFYGDDKCRRPIKEETRTRKVNQWIKEHFMLACVNIDYGTVNEREHHHLVGLLIPDTELVPVINEKTGKQVKSKSGFPLWNIKNDNYNLGFIPDIEIIEDKSNDEKLKKISNYLLKINNHSNKPTTKNRRWRMIRNEKYMITKQEYDDLIRHT